MAMAGIVSDAENRLSRRQIAWLVANEIPDGAYVNLGIGIPTLCADHMPSQKEILLHSENGVLGFGPRPEEGDEDRRRVVELEAEAVGGEVIAARLAHGVGERRVL